MPKAVALQVIISLVALSPLLFAEDHLASTKGDSLSGHVAIKVNVDLVMLPVTVTDNDGRPITGLKQENFRIYDNGKEQRTLYFNTEDVPISMGLVLDRSGSMAEVIDEVYKAAYQSVEASKPGDDFFLVTFNDEPRLEQDFTADLGLLRERLRTSKASGQTALYDAIDMALDLLNEARNERKALLVITDGDDNNSQSSFREVLQRAAEEDVLLYTIGLFKRRPDARRNWPLIGGIRRLFEMGASLGDNHRALKKRLKKLSEATGARAYFPRTPKECELANIAIAEELRQQYILGYYPKTERSEGNWHTIEVRLQPSTQPLPKHLMVRTRPGYFPRVSNQMAGNRSNR